MGGILVEVLGFKALGFTVLGFGAACVVTTGAPLPSPTVWAVPSVENDTLLSAIPPRAGPKEQNPAAPHLGELARCRLR